MNTLELIQKQITRTIKLEMKALKRGDLDAVLFFKRRLIRLEQFAETMENEVLILK